MIGRIWLASFAIVLTAATSAPATFVDNITPSAGTGAGQNADLTSFDFTDNDNNDPGPFENEGYVGPGAANGNFTDMSFDVLQQGNPFSVQVTRVGGNNQAAEYWFEVTLNNTTGATINEVGIGLWDAPNSGVGALQARFDLPDGFNSSGGTFTRISDSFAIFSGLGLAAGASQTLGFSLDFLSDFVGPRLDHNRPIFMQFTATPEPHAVLLGGLSLMAFVGVMLQRRRQAKVVPVNDESGSI
jgi:hypothetical protein